MSLIPAITGALPSGAQDLFGLALRGLAPAPGGLPLDAPALPQASTAPAPLAPAPLGWTTLTPEALRDALLDMGEAVSEANLELAQALTHLGLALTPASLGEARVALARAPGTDATAFALARFLNLSPTPAVLRALSAVTQGLPALPSLPQDVMDALGLSAHAGADPEALAAELHSLVQERLRTAEHLLQTGDADSARRHSRTDLLRLLEASDDAPVRAGADALASHLEGQFLVNVAAQEHQPPLPLYFALPLQMPDEQAMLEMSVQPWDGEREGDADDEAPYAQATFRLATARLGGVEATITGTLSGKLVCRLSAQKPSTLRLLRRGEASLAASLCALGWPRCTVSCQQAREWRPLWQGGVALSAPRPRGDWRA